MKSAFFASLMVLGTAQVCLPQIVNHTQGTGPYTSLSAAQADERTRDGDVLVVSGHFQEDSVFHLVKSLTVSGGGFTMSGGVHCGTAGRSLTLSHLIVDGSAVPGTNHGIHQGWAGTPGCAFTLNQVTIRNFRGKGLYLQGGAHGYSNLVISAVGQTGVHVRDSRLSGTGLSVHGCGGDAIELQDGGDWDARGVTTLRNSGGGGHGILEGGSGVYVFETLNLDNVENGIHHGFGDGGRLTIHGGTWQNLRKHAVQVGQEDDSNEGPNKIWTLNQVTLRSTQDANIRYWGLDFGGTPRAHTLILNRCTVLDTNHHFLEQKQQSNAKAVFKATDCKVDKGNARVDFFMTYGSPEGGSFTFEKCTIQNFAGFNHDGALYYNWDLCNNVPPTSRQSVTFRNCLIENFGNHTVCITDDELGLRPDYVGSNTLTFEGCTLRNVAQGPDRHAFALWRGNNTEVDPKCWTTERDK